MGSDLRSGRLGALRTALLVLTPLLAVGCSGLVGDGGAGAPGGPPSGRLWNGSEPVPAASAELFECDPEESLDLARRARRLSPEEIGNAIIDLFGSDVFVAAEAELQGLTPTTVTLRRDSLGADLGQEEMAGLFGLFDRVGEAAADGDVLGEYHRCDGSANDLSGVCVRELVERLGLRVFRRPLEADEVDHFALLYRELSPQGASGLVTSLLLSPSFLFHIEDGVPVSGNGMILSQLEVASRLSFMIQDSIPDERLLALATEGGLTGATFAAEAERLLTSERGRAKLKAFFRDWLAVRTVPPVADNAHLTGDLDAATFGDESLDELDRFVEYVVYEKRGSLGDLFLGAEVFPDTAQMASFYGVPQWQEGEPPSINAGLARGVMLRPPTLISGRNETSPILRGVFIKNHILCDEIPEPPSDDVIAAQEGTVDANDYSTVREKTVALTSAPACAGCHQLINPVGFALEDMGPLGRFRVEEAHYENGEVVATYPVDASVDDLRIDGELVSVGGAAELVREIAQSQQASACFATRYFEFSQERSETDHNADRCQLARMHGRLTETDGSVLGLLSAAFSEAVVSTRRVQ